MTVHNPPEAKIMCHLCPWQSRSKTSNPKHLVFHLYDVHGVPIPDHVKV